MSSERTYGVSLTLEEIKAVRMTLRWGIPSPTPPALRDAQAKLAKTQSLAEEDVKADV